MKANNRNTQIDCLRGIACLLVIGVHFHFAPPPGPLGCVAEIWKRVGHVGVDLFFVLSGFLIGSLLLTEMERYGKLNVPRFLIRRGFKLYPVYYVFMAYCILVPAVVSAISLNHNGWATLADKWKDHLSDLVFIQNYAPRDAEGHTWSLAVEEHFYLVLPLVIALLGPKRVWNWLIPICLCSLPICLGLRALEVFQHPSEVFPFGLTHLRVDDLLSGVALAVISLRFPETFTRLGGRPRLLIAGGVFLWLVAFLPFWPEALQDSLGFTVRLAGSVAILLGTCNLRNARIGRVQELLAWTGVNSYAVYVWHVTGIGMMEKSVGSLIHDHVKNQSLQWLLLASAIVVFCVAIGALVTKLVEAPALNLRNKLFPSRGKSLALPNDAARPSPPIIPGSPAADSEVGRKLPPATRMAQATMGSQNDINSPDKPPAGPAAMGTIEPCQHNQSDALAALACPNEPGTQITPDAIK
jgi:peptidoglycan/LPS O-acetylase OafA/YrhL